MTIEPQGLVRQIHDAGTRFVVAVAGGGAEVIAQLLKVPGASRAVLAAAVPYCDAAMTEWLGATPGQSCSAATARAMAMAAFGRARRYEQRDLPRAGLACTASLSTDRPRRGKNRVHLAAQTAEATVTWSLELAKNRRSRGEEERLAGRLLLNLIAQTCGLTDRLSFELLEDEHLDQSIVEGAEPWRDLLLGRVDRVRVGGSPEHGGFSGKAAIFPGSFNPLHAGHRHMAQIASQRLGLPVEFEISILNADKPPLDYAEIDRRIKQFARGETLWLTRSPTFLAKSGQFPGATFVVGVDTIKRVADPHFYGDDPLACQEAIEQIAARACRFLVFGRKVGDRFLTLSDLELPPTLRVVCEAIPADAFREDVSSTEIRSLNDRELL